MSNVLRKIVLINYQQVRFLPRWSHRHPVRVIQPEQYEINTDNVKKRSDNFGAHFDVEEPQLQSQISEKINWKRSRENAAQSEPKSEKFKLKRNIKPLTIQNNKKKSIDMLEATIDAEGNFIYTKMNDNDSRVGTILTQIKSKKEKDKKDLILLEGKRLIKDALESGCKLEYIIFARVKELEHLKPYLPKFGAKLYKMPYREMQLWSDLTTNPGIMGIFKIPDTASTSSKDALPLTVICDNIREPNNLGAILRTCSGVGCETVFLTKGCVNVWDTKVLRSGSGAHFKLRIHKKQSWDEIKEAITPSANIFIADNNTIPNGNNNEDFVTNVPVIPYYSVDFKLSKQIILIIGGETEGISEESYKIASECSGARLNVPLSNNLDSLNTGTALGVIAFEIKRQLMIGKGLQEEESVN